MGFTLIEMIIVLALVGTAAAIALIAVGNQSSTDVQAACASDYTAVQTARDSYREEIGVYPQAILPPGDSANPASSGDGPGVDALMGTITTRTGTVGPWLKELPSTPNRYEIRVTYDGNGTVGVYSTAPVPTQIPSATPTNTVADCQKVP